MNLTRKARTAARGHRCEGCEEFIEKGWTYIEDQLTEASYPSQGVRTIASMRWHMHCAPLVKSEALAMYRSTVRHQ